jgi:hypothetical protein
MKPGKLMKMIKYLFLSLIFPLPLIAAEAPPSWSPSIVATVTRYCEGDAATIRAVKRYCVFNCSSSDWTSINQFCSDLTADQQLANQQPQPQPDNSEPADQQTQAQIVTAYCHGDPEAFNTIQQYCQKESCTSKTYEDIKQHCAGLGVTVDTGLLLAGPPPAEPSDATRNLTVSWSIPLQRVNGESLSASELKGYEIYFTSNKGSKDATIVVNDPHQTEHTIENLAPDTYHVALVAKDNNGVYSDLSEMVSVTIGDSGA